MNMSFMEYLNARSEYEVLASSFVMPEEKCHGTIESMEWFLENGHIANRFRKGFDDATMICSTIVKEMKA